MFNRVALIILRFGPNNGFFDIWLKTAISNNSIDFLLMTDNLNDYNKYFGLYPNIKFFYITRNEVERRIKEKTGFTYKFVSGYKLCDFKPALGLLFEDYIEDYDFWGYCDTDLVFGNMKSFITDELLNSYDRLFCLGHLSIYKNNKFMRELFLQTSKSKLNFEMVCNTDKVIGFDETEGLHQICLSYGDKIRYYTNHANICDVDIFHYQMFNSISARIQKPSRAFIWKNGELIAISLSNSILTPLLYAHFQKRTIDVKTIDLSKNCISFFCTTAENIETIEETRICWKKHSSKFKSINYYLLKKTNFVFAKIKRKIIK